MTRGKKKKERKRKMKNKKETKEGRVDKADAQWEKEG